MPLRIGAEMAAYAGAGPRFGRSMTPEHPAAKMSRAAD